MNPGEELALAQELDRRVYARAAQEVAQLDLGWSYRHHDMPDVHMVNGVRLRAPLPDELSAADVAAIAEQELSGLRHRQVVLDDAPAAERLAEDLRSTGWERQRTVWMSLRGDRSLAAPDSRARELEEGELRAFQLADLTQPQYGRPGPITELVVDALAAVRASTPVRRFGAGEDDAVQSSCTLFLDAEVEGRRVAMVESVGTLREHRERGLAKAVVSEAARAAGAWGADLVVVPADADDWPQLLYARLGFSPVGRQVVFTLRPGSA